LAGDGSTGGGDGWRHLIFYFPDGYLIVCSLVSLTIDTATCIENHVRDDSWNEALIPHIRRISDLETFTESILACASIIAFDGHTR